MKKTVGGSIRFLIISILVFGGFYTMLVTGVGQLFFNEQANGSQINYNKKVIGSKFIGQPFEQEKYFTGRSEQVSQLSPVSREQMKIVEKRTSEQIIMAQTEKKVPIDLVTASASGVDPDISVEAANYQVPRIAKKRKISEKSIYNIIEKNTQKDWFSHRKFVNVLQLNIALDRE